VAGFSVPEPVLWQFLLHPVTNNVVITAVTRASFIDSCLNGGELRHLTVFRQASRIPRHRYVRRYR
jgi:hypothetical protein